MSNAKPLTAFGRALRYTNQNNPDPTRYPMTMGRFTPAQKRRTKHKNHKMLGAAGGGVVKPKQVKTRQTRPAPVAGGLRNLLSPSQVRQRVAVRSARTGITFKVKAPAGQTMIIDDMQRGNGDR